MRIINNLRQFCNLLNPHRPPVFSTHCNPFNSTLLHSAPRYSTYPTFQPLRLPENPWNDSAFTLGTDQILKPIRYFLHKSVILYTSTQAWKSSTLYVCVHSVNLRLNYADMLQDGLSNRHHKSTWLILEFLQCPYVRLVGNLQCHATPPAVVWFPPSSGRVYVQQVKRAYCWLW